MAATASSAFQLQPLNFGFRLWVSACDIRLAAEKNMFSQKQATVKKLNTKRAPQQQQQQPHTNK